MTTRLFTLTMPNNNSWNGKWTGEGYFFGIVKSYKLNSDALKNVDKKNHHYYDFGDGWGASVSIEKIDGRKSAGYRRRSRGFSGYDWMITEIEKYGRILTRDERQKKEG